MNGNENISFHMLNVFIKVSETKSINQSSKVLLLTQPAISKKIHQLEEYVGQQLFTRSSKGMALTYNGHIFYIFATQMLAELTKTIDEINNKNFSFNDLNMGVLDSISSFLFPNFFVNKVYELQNLEVTNKVFDLIKPFNEGKLDAIIIDSSFSENIIGPHVQNNLFEEPYYIVYSKSNTKIPTLIKDSIAKAIDLQKFKLVLLPMYCPIHQQVVKVFDRLNVALPEIFENDYSELTISLVKNSDFVTVLPESIAINKITQDINGLGMKKLEIAFDRSVSIFGRSKNIVNEIEKELVL
ncbi:LysR family transcriptional regulator [Leuconostoc gelidum subsp. gelidum]|uniref:LysR family transcriptional regulator n=1 Tax=Leuconostoc gelidum subsp. gelidum TaxID=1607839 RepID=A0AB35FZL3_LEUGE|nr:LysR family transcriptional regulator [Leuconostoc gelidum]MBZ5965039.1 LysR family transcriptional regulator [Leuconostoc gelidum subsp. gelidum]MBZ5974396.1 LysR family transcriptional regulator [Leuconostoc gelidum subsp. gelidum]MBZ5977235.1 LysR family transcriptional regulator [Leuconostoc gelidum subsp. gelidum]MBZ5985723.1 LysR family transcriptional regulator [Leuconostoc gelidum subsp. gelidum]MBZ5998887.1 LysR family transcriptional regulator [Leuconostoc gelidum subsp. gelidum]